MQRVLATLIALLLAGAIPTATAAERVQDARIGSIFARHGASGTLLLYNPDTDRLHGNDFSRADRRFLPASTFKIPHALIALETGAVSSASEVIRWDRRKRGWDKWDRDQTLGSALTYSAVWAFQVVARRIGRKRMAAWVGKLEYGNADISGRIDTFWLDGALRISAMEQVAFLRRLHKGTLPSSAEAQAEVRRLLVIEDTDNYTLRAKTGWAKAPDPDIGWYVGWIEAGSKKMFFALNLDMHRPDTDRHARIHITWEALELFGFDILP